MTTTMSDSAICVTDYVVFGLTLAMSAAIGFFYAFKDRKNNDMNNFHRSKRQANPISVSLSLAVSIVSAVTILGLPAEVYSHGTMTIWQLFGAFLATGFSAHVILPIFYNMGKISVFEYLEMRFGKVPRLIGSAFYLINACILISCALYAPSLAFEAATGVSFWIVMVVAACVCMTYTLFGGMKAVLWADTLQCFVIIAGVVTVLVEGSRAVGGFTSAWEIARNHSRIEILNLSFDPRTRHTVWSLTIGFFVSYNFALGTNQATVQRSCSLSSLRTAKIAQWTSFIPLSLIITLSISVGVVMFAYYCTCDPVMAGRIARKDQMFPLMAVDILGKTPGLCGLLLSGLFSGSLSTISSGLSAISAVIVEDFVKPYREKPICDTKQLFISKIIVVVASIVIFFVAGGISQIGGLLFQLLITTSGLFGTQILGLFLMGMLFPWVNIRGIYIGLVVSVGLTGWLMIGSLINAPPPAALPVSIEGCRFLPVNTTTESMNETTTMRSEVTDVNDLYKVSYLWYLPFEMTVLVVVSLIVSFITGPNNPKNIDSSLMVPLFYNICPFLPDHYRRKLSFGVEYQKLKSLNVAAADNNEKELKVLIEYTDSYPCKT